jgi:hypothetical protein
MSAITHVSDPGVHWVAGDPARSAALIRLRAVRMVAPLGCCGEPPAPVPATGPAEADNGGYAPV